MGHKIIAKLSLLTLMMLGLLACGVKGRPLPPENPAPLAVGREGFLRQQPNSQKDKKEDPKKPSSIYDKPSTTE